MTFPAYCGACGLGYDGTHDCDLDLRHFVRQSFTITIETNNPKAREVIRHLCESQLIAVDFDGERHHDTWIDAVTADGTLIYATELDGRANNEGT